MKDATAAGGTSLEVLAPYLPYGIDVQVMDANVPGTQRRLAGFYYGDKTFVHKMNGNKIELGWLSLDIARLLPVLRPLSQLCQPLEDGIVPAVKLAYMIFDNMVGDGEEVHAGLDHFGNVVVAAGAVRVMSITPDWLFCPEDGNHAGPAEYRKLLEWHFAVGLELGQYVAKEPATPKNDGAPTIQEGAPDAL